LKSVLKYEYFTNSCILRYQFGTLSLDNLWNWIQFKWKQSLLDNDLGSNLHNLFIQHCQKSRYICV